MALERLSAEELEQFRSIAYKEAELAVRRGALRIEEEDGSPGLRRPKVLKVTNGDLTDNGDGTLTLGGGTPAAGSITGAQLATGDIKQTLIAGGAAGNHTVTGIASGDELSMVLHHTAGAALADLTSEFTVTGANTINNAAGTDTTGDQLLVFWISKS